MGSPKVMVDTLAMEYIFASGKATNDVGRVDRIASEA